MIRAVLVVGWIGLALLLAAGLSGYRVDADAGAQTHLTMALFPTGALLFVDLCVIAYIVATVWIVRRNAAAFGLLVSFLDERRRVARAVLPWAAAGAIVVGVLFASGFKVYVQTWPVWVHHVGFLAGGALHAVLLVRAHRALRDGEAQLAAFGAAVEAAGGR